MPEILPPSIGSMSPKLGLMGWRVYSILPVSATKKELYHFDFYKPIILKYENFVNKKYKNNELIYLLLSFFVEYLQKCRNIAILNEKEYTNLIGGDSFDL